MSNHKQPKNKEQLRGAPLQSPVAVNAENKRYQWLWLVPLLVLGLFWFSQSQQNDFERLSYSEFKQKVQSGDVARVTFEGDKIEGWYRAPQGTGDNANATDSAAEDAQNTEQSAQFEGFTTVKPPLEDSALLGLLDRNKVTVQAESTDSGMWRLLLIGVLPWLLLLGLIFYSVRMQKRMYQGGGQGGPFNFGQSKAKRFAKQKTEVDFEQIAGVKNAKRDLREIVDYLKKPERYYKLKAKIPKGVLLMGPPGTGKTMLAKAVAGEADVPFYSISGSEFIEMFVGVGAARVRDMFEQAKNDAPAIIFIDELDSIGRARGAGLGGGHDEREQTLNQILNEMDGFSPHENVVVLAATNRPDVLDSALMRPGRFDRKVTLELPDREARAQILRVHTNGMPLTQEVDFTALARRTVGFSGADLENLANEAGLLAGRQASSHIDMDMFEQAREKIVLGAERETALDERDKRVIAYHESGHALVAWLLPEADPLEKVTIIPRGRALGATAQTPEEERYNFNTRYLRGRLAVMMGGRVAERVIFEDVTSGAQSDLKQATQLAQRMICHWGMSERLGPVAFQRSEDHIFLGKELAQQQDFSDHTARLIDEEVYRLLTETEQEVKSLLENHRESLEKLAEALLEHETLTSEEVAALFDDRLEQKRNSEARKAG